MVVFVGFVVAVRAGQFGAVRPAMRAIWVHAVTLFVILLIVFGGSTENIMTTRPATVKWLLFPLEVLISVGAAALSRRMVVHRDVVTWK